MNKIFLISKILVISILLTVVSVGYHRLNPTITGNVCGDPPDGWCYEDLPAGGFPVSYLYDAGSISIVGKLDFIDDHFYLGSFLIDFAFYFVIISIVLLLVVFVRKKLQKV